MSVFEGIKLPNVIYKAKSKFNEDIQVVESNGTRRLLVNNYTQSVNFESPLAERMVWGRTLRLLQEEEPELNTILILFVCFSFFFVSKVEIFSI